MSSYKFKDLHEVEFMWRNKGIWPDGTPVGNSPEKRVQDALSVPDAPVLMPKVLSNVAREAIEPMLVGERLLQRVEYHYGQTVSFPAVGALVADDISEAQEYPEKQLQIGGGTVTANIGKVGVACAVTEEMVRYSNWDVIGMHVRAAGRAMARHKEQKIFNFISAMGVKLFDNVTPTTSMKGVLTGRALDGTQNGSFTADDFFDGFGHLMLQGFIPNTILLHPLTWALWVKDPVLRAFAMQNGGGTWFAGWNGNPASRFDPWRAASQNGLGRGTGVNLVSGPDAQSGGAASSGTAATALTEFSQTLDSSPQMPSYFPFPVTMVVSPLVPFDPRRKLTDIYLFDRENLGVLLVDEDLTTEQFNEPRFDITKLKFRERYGIGILNEGQAVGVFKNVHVVPNEVVLPAQTTLDVATSALATINHTASVL